jgi:hypothetical protein
VVVTGIGTSETQIVVSGFKTISGDNITQAMIGGENDRVPITISPRTPREEQVLAKVVSASGDNITLDIQRAVNPVAPYNVGGGVAQPHNVNDTVVISNNPALFNKLTAKDNDETITADWTFDGDNTHNGEETFTGTIDATTGALKIADAVANDEPYNKLQADTLLGAKANANATVNLTGNQTVEGVKTFDSSPVIPSASGATDAVNKGQMESYIAAESGDIKASDTAFGTTKLDVAADDVDEPIAYSATANRVAALSGGGDFGTPSSTNKFLTEEFLTGRIVRYTYNLADSPATWTKKAGLKYVYVQLWGGGGSGGRRDGSGATADGGGGAYNEKYIEVGDLGSTETVTVGAGGAAQTTNSSGVAGGTTSFGSHVLAYGGGGGGQVGPSSGWPTGGGGGGQFGAGGTANGTAGSPGNPIVGSSVNSILKHATHGGGGGGGQLDGGSVTGGNSVWGGGGGSRAGAGGLSVFGGNGGVGNGVSGAVPGGGGAGGKDIASSGAGGAGRVIVTEYYS